MTKKAPTSSNSDKRDFFRISQDVLFDYKIVEAFSAENDEPDGQFEDGKSMSLLDELRRLDRDGLQALKILSEKNRLLGDYLRNLSQKIDLIARHTLFGSDDTSSDQPTMRVNLSEDGLAFASDRAIYVGNFLVLRLIFLPHYLPVVTFAQVVRCEQKGETYQIAARFHRLAKKDRQVLARQILKAQVDHKKALNNKTSP